MATCCDRCGKKIVETKPIMRKLNGRYHYCCSIRCEVEWEKEQLVGVCG